MTIEPGCAKKAKSAEKKAKNTECKSKSRKTLMIENFITCISGNTDERNKLIHSLVKKNVSEEIVYSSGV